MFYKLNQIREWFIYHEKEIFVGLLVIFSSCLAYGLGRLTKLQESQAPVTITLASSTVATAVQTIQVLDKEVSSDTRIVVSKNGTKYYFPWCGGGRVIKLENRVYFNTAIEAESAGYTRASNCQPKP